MTNSAAQRQSTNTSCGNDSARGSKSERMGGVIDVAPDTSAANRGGARSRIDPRVFDRREVDYQTVITNSQTARVVSATSDRDEQIIVSSEIHRTYYVCDIDAPCNQARLFVNHPVINLAGFIIVWVIRLDECASETSFE